ncbi:MAG TPA: serine protease, partial [Cryomorphaceae bacterium]|nr:serine protease [Cryomorphaceae bacterium]
VDLYNPTVVEIRDAKLAVMRNYMQADPALNILLASSYAQTANYWKYYIGQTEQLVNNHVYQKKADLEAQFTAWVAAEPKRQAKYGETLSLMQQYYAATDASVKNQVYLMEAVIRGPSAVLFAYRTARALERGVSNPEMMAKMMPAIQGQAEGHFAEFHGESDRDLMAVLWKMYAANIPVGQQPRFIQNVVEVGSDFDAYAAHMYATSLFMDPARFAAFLAAPDSATLANDPLTKVANDFREAYFGGQDPTLAEKKTKAYRLWTAGVREMLPNEDWSPDANSTMRMTFGKVGSYEPKDGVTYNYTTTLDGVMQKEDPTNPEFEVPQRLKDLYNAKDFGRYADAQGKLPVGLITDNDITGGNSGSPLINGKGELIGIAFDGNWEAMSGDIFFEDELQRTISVDIRYVLFIVDKYAGARHLVDEMTLHY